MADLAHGCESGEGSSHNGRLWKFQARMGRVTGRHLGFPETIKEGRIYRNVKFLVVSCLCGGDWVVLCGWLFAAIVLTMAEQQ